MLDFDEALMAAEDPDDIKKMKAWMFQEQVRIQSKRDELHELSRELQDLKRKLEREKIFWTCVRRRFKSGMMTMKFLSQRNRKLLRMLINNWQLTGRH